MARGGCTSSWSVSRSPEDREAWARGAETATPLKGRKAHPPPRPVQKPSTKTPALSQPSPLPRKAKPPQVDRALVDKIVRGAQDALCGSVCVCVKARLT